MNQLLASVYYILLRRALLLATVPSYLSFLRGLVGGIVGGRGWLLGVLVVRASGGRVFVMACSCPPDGNNVTELYFRLGGCLRGGKLGIAIVYPRDASASTRRSGGIIELRKEEKVLRLHALGCLHGGAIPNSVMVAKGCRPRKVLSLLSGERACVLTRKTRCLTKGDFFQHYV